MNDRNLRWWPRPRLAVCRCHEYLKLQPGRVPACAEMSLDARPEAVG
jgi:hypothetical protein